MATTRSVMNAVMPQAAIGARRIRSVFRNLIESSTKPIAKCAKRTIGNIAKSILSTLEKSNRSFVSRIQPTIVITTANGRARTPDKRAEKDNKRRAFKMGQDNTFTAQEWAELKRHYNYTCLRCGRREPEIKLTADHVVPISKGGWRTINNIQPLCRSCNSAKYDDIIDYRPK
jgi:5-methylcytosine-specific restriction endonuclease McrA